MKDRRFSGDAQKFLSCPPTAAAVSPIARCAIKIPSSVHGQAGGGICSVTVSGKGVQDGVCLRLGGDRRYQENEKPLTARQLLNCDFVRSESSQFSSIRKVRFWVMMLCACREEINFISHHFVRAERQRLYGGVVRESSY